MIFFPKKVFPHHLLSLFCKKFQKSFKFGKFENAKKNENFMIKKRFHALKKHPQQIWRAEDMLVVAKLIVRSHF